VATSPSSTGSKKLRPPSAAPSKAKKAAATKKGKPQRPGFAPDIQERVKLAQDPQNREGPLKRDYTTESETRISLYNDCRGKQNSKFLDFQDLSIGEKIFATGKNKTDGKSVVTRRIETIIYEAKVLLGIKPQTGSDSDKALAEIIRTNHAKLQAVADEIVCRYLRPSELAMIYYVLTKPYNANNSKVSGMDGKRLHVRVMNMPLKFDDPETGAYVGTDGRKRDLNAIRGEFVGKLEVSEKSEEVFPKLFNANVHYNMKLSNNLIRLTEENKFLYVWFGTGGGPYGDNKLAIYEVMPDYVDAADLKVDHAEKVMQDKDKENADGAPPSVTKKQELENTNMEKKADKKMFDAAKELMEGIGVTPVLPTFGTISMPVSQTSSKGITRPPQ
jgi:hypothetical protein